MKFTTDIRLSAFGITLLSFLVALLSTFISLAVLNKKKFSYRYISIILSLTMAFAIYMFVLTPSASVLASSLNLDGSINWIKFNWFFQIGVNAQSPTVLDLQIRNNPDYLPLLINSIIFGSILIAGITLFFCSKRKINNIIKK
ncbi:MAG: hypothetical protein LBS95_02325 [Mycoplasmataceae bacterium]|nr:hypothetical protein [Mycoplasmataceae bacterium]